MGTAARTFEELHIYQRSRELTNSIYKITKNDSFSRDYELIRQIRRAGISIMSNIAEGFERGSTAEFIQFLYISKGSCGEVRAQIQIAKDQGYIDDQEYRTLYNNSKQISTMISKFITHLQKSNYKGDKFSKTGS